MMVFVPETSQGKDREWKGEGGVGKGGNGEGVRMELVKGKGGEVE